MIKNIADRQLKFNKKAIIKINKSKIYHEYILGDILYHKSHVFVKTDSLYTGPYKIIEIKKCKQRLLLKGKSKVFFLCNMKNIKPSEIKKEKAECGSLTLY
ncbi:hypothetical protein DMUE_4055 [Dictyocoela muelleri]|nr:hypothetical protein DMUE_4055 [Dictyocoela muelleri]